MTVWEGGVPASPRSEAEPFAFTRDEFWHGAFAGWWMTVGVSGVLLLGATWGGSPGLAILIVGMITLAAVAPIAFCVTLLFAPAVYVLARSLRRVARVWVHVAVMSVAGLALGTLTTLVVTLIVGPVFVPASWIAYAAAPAAGLPLAWLRAARRARLADAGRLPHPKPHPDAVAEDRLADALRAGDGGGSAG